MSVITPRWIKDYARSESGRNETDSLDAEVIARYGLTHEPRPLDSASPNRTAAKSPLLRPPSPSHLNVNPALRADCTRLCALPGIGLKTARWLCAELPRHLPSNRAAAACWGLTPRLRQSGSSISACGSLALFQMREP